MNNPRVSAVLLFAFVAIFAVAKINATRPSHPRVGSVTPAGRMLEPRSGHSATLLPYGRVLIAGGMRRNQDFYRSAEIYDPASGKFTPTGEMAIARVGHAAELLHSGKVLIAGGWISHDCTDSAELYDPATGKFTTIANMTTRRGRPQSVVLPDGDVLITGGEDHDARDGAVASAEIFHAATLTFEPLPPMRAARVAHTMTLLNDGRVLIAGGRGETLNASAEIYDPKTRRFTETGSLITARYKHTAGLLPDGRVLIAGGSDDRDWHGTMNSAEIYDSRTGKFTATSPLNDSRFKLPDVAVSVAPGELLIAGGSRKVEVYDAASGKFLVASGEISDSWHYLSETRLKDGRVLLAGGYPDNDHTTALAWIYTP
jgi:WD40 repeat protein